MQLLNAFRKLVELSVMLKFREPVIGIHLLDFLVVRTFNQGAPTWNQIIRCADDFKGIVKDFPSGNAGWNIPSIFWFFNMLAKLPNQHKVDRRSSRKTACIFYFRLGGTRRDQRFVRKGEICADFNSPSVKCRFIKNQLYRTPASMYKFKRFLPQKHFYIFVQTATKRIESIGQIGHSIKFRCPRNQFT